MEGAWCARSCRSGPSSCMHSQVSGVITQPCQAAHCASGARQLGVSASKAACLHASLMTGPNQARSCTIWQTSWRFTLLLFKMQASLHRDLAACCARWHLVHLGSLLQAAGHAVQSAGHPLQAGPRRLGPRHVWRAHLSAHVSVVSGPWSVGS